MPQQLLPARFILIYLALFAACVLATDTGCHDDARGDTIRATITAVDAARDGFLQWNRDASDKIITDAKDRGATREQVIAELDAHDKKVDDVVSLIMATYRAAALAANKSDDRSLKDAIKAASALFDAVARVKQGAP